MLTLLTSRKRSRLIPEFMSLINKSHQYLYKWLLTQREIGALQKTSGTYFLGSPNWVKISCTSAGVNVRRDLV